MYKLLIFDWDGTIIDSASRIISSMQSAAVHCGVEVPSDDAVRNIIGLGLPEAIKAIIPNIDESGVQQMQAQYGHYFLNVDTTPARLFEGVEASLKRMFEQNLRMAVATGKSRKGLDRALASTELAPYFETSRCADETLSKPNPLMLQEILNETCVDVKDAVMIGDTEYDLGMAKAIGMDSIAVSYGAHQIDRLTQYEPVLIANKFADIENWLQQTNA